MTTPTQQELMAAHNISRHSAARAAATAKKGSTVVDIVDPRRKPEQLPPEHPFGGNDNNRRVAERILRESKTSKNVVTPTPLTPAQSAQADLDRADELDASNEQPMTEEEQEAAENARTAAILAAKQAATAPSDPAAPPAPPTWTPGA